MSKIDILAQKMVDGIKNHIKSYVDPKFKELQDAFSNMPLPEKGEKGEKGDAGEVDIENIKKMISDAVSAHFSMQIVEPKYHPDISDIVADEVRKQFESISIPKDGEKGDPGEDGRDALHLDILPSIDEEKSYPRGTYATYKGGLWRSFEKTHGMRGWECIVDGFDKIEIYQHDERSFSVKTQKSSGKVVKEDFSVPSMIFRGTYEYERKYLKGDAVTWNGSTWIAMSDTEQSPNTGSDDWKLAVKAGRNANPPVKVKHA